MQVTSIWKQWLKKRFRFEQSKKIGQRDILIFIYQQGFLYLVLILITFIAGINYANNLILGFCFLISAILCISFYITFKQLHGLEIDIITDEVGQVGHSILFKIYLNQPYSYSRYLSISIDSETQHIHIDQKQSECVIQIQVDQRGQYNYPDIHIASVYPFGLVRAWTYIFHGRHAWIAPQAKINPNTSFSNAFVLDQEKDEFKELRSFQVGDSLQSVSWKQAARGQGLYIKVFEEHQQDRCVDIHYHHMPSVEHEEKLKYMMGVVEQCEQLQISFKLVLPHAELNQGFGAEHIKQAKILLAQA